VKEEELLRGGRRKKVSKVRAKIAYRLSREIGLSLAETAEKVSVRTSAVAMALRGEKSDGIPQCPPVSPVSAFRP
jgi:hypothetical protein